MSQQSNVNVEMHDFSCSVEVDLQIDFVNIRRFAISIKNIIRLSKARM